MAALHPIHRPRRNGNLEAAPSGVSSMASSRDVFKYILVGVDTGSACKLIASQICVVARGNVVIGYWPRLVCRLGRLHDIASATREIVGEVGE